MLYLDTSILVAALTHETETARMQAWLADQEPGGLTISAWVSTEFSAALSIKVRMGHLDPEQRAAVLALFQSVAAASLKTVPISDHAFRTAARFADQIGLGLRAGDALHLAIAADAGVPLATLDRKLAEAGRSLGLDARLV